MKLKRTIGLVLAAVMTISGLNFSYANEPPNEMAETADEITTGSALEPSSKGNEIDLPALSEASPIDNEEPDMASKPQTIKSSTDNKKFHRHSLCCRGRQHLL